MEREQAVETISIKQSEPSLRLHGFSTWFFARRYQLAETLACFCFGEQVTTLFQGVVVSPIGRWDGYSGYDLRLGPEATAQIRFSPLQYGGFILKKALVEHGQKTEVYESYSEDGHFLAAEPTCSMNVLYVDLTNMEPKCPIISHLYNYLCHEYEQAQQGFARSKQIHYVENFLRSLTKKSSRLSVQNFPIDLAIQTIWESIIEAEKDPVLNWNERQKVISEFYAVRSKIIRTKIRTHKIGGLKYRLPILLGDFKNFFERIWMRPASNIKGVSYKYTIGLLLWFLHTVRSNIGYSIALAIYGPFTFYFITQPLNPHAMWAVGKVRSAYLDTLQQVKVVTGQKDLVKTEDKTEEKQTTTPTPNATTVPIVDPMQKLSKYSASHLGFLLSTDVPATEQQPWNDRMSNFKDMQIGYEENMVFAARMGRLEQMETQLAFPLVADSAWQEIERYLAHVIAVKSQLSTNPAFFGDKTKAFSDFLAREEGHARRLQLYVWDRLLRYLLDHPYIVLDQSREQVYHDYYMGHSLILFKDMTMKLAKLHNDFKKPSEFKKIEKLANAFQKSRVDADSVLERVAKNSGLFAQKDRFDGLELRSYMRRQWEVLYLLQNKAQEASNFGLSTYTWSVRNALWILQSAYSAKRQELTLLTQAPAASKDLIDQEIRKSIDPFYESLFHLLNLEFVSIRPELSGRLNNDIEFAQRQEVIKTIEESFKDREQVLKTLAGK